MVIDMQNFMAMVDSLIVCKFALTCSYTVNHLLGLIEATSIRVLKLLFIFNKNRITSRRMIKEGCLYE